MKHYSNKWEKDKGVNFNVGQTRIIVDHFCPHAKHSTLNQEHLAKIHF